MRIPGRDPAEAQTLKGQRYNHERIARQDSATGVRVLQLTSFPTMSMTIGYTQNIFSEDSSKLIFLSQRTPQRDSPWDLFMVGSDGSGLVQLTGVDDLRSPQLSPDGKTAYYVRGPSLWAVDTQSFQEREVATLEGGSAVYGSHLSPDGRYFFIPMSRASKSTDWQQMLKENLLVRFDIRKGVAEPITDNWVATASDPEGKGLMCINFTGKQKVYGFVHYDGVLEGVFTSTHDFAHSTLLGPAVRVQGCALYPERAILMLGLGEEVPKPLVKGPYFWHSSSSRDGKWIVSDTNWPNEGLKLVSVERGSFKTLLYPGNSAGHPQWTHPHPSLSPDGRKVLYNSDATGICQVYVAAIPEDFLLPESYGSAPRRKRR